MVVRYKFSVHLFLSFWNTHSIGSLQPTSASSKSHLLLVLRPPRSHSLPQSLLFPGPHRLSYTLNKGCRFRPLILSFPWLPGTVMWAVPVWLGMMGSLIRMVIFVVLPLSFLRIVVSLEMQFHLPSINGFPCVVCKLWSFASVRCRTSHWTVWFVLCSCHSYDCTEDHARVTEDIISWTEVATGSRVGAEWANMYRTVF